MPNYGTRQSPWVGGGDMGETFYQFMTAMSALKQQQANLADEHAFRQAELSQRAPLVAAQAENMRSDAALGAAKTRAIGENTANATDASLWSFAREMSSNPGYNPLQESQLADTPENRKQLIEAMLARYLTANAATSPEAATRMASPIEANANTVVYAPSGREIGRGSVTKTGSATHALSPGSQLFDESGNMIAENSMDRSNPLSSLTSLFRGSTDAMTTLGKDTPYGEPLYQGNPELGNAYTNSAALLREVAPMIIEELKKRNLPTKKGTNAAPAAATSKYKILNVK